MRRTGLVMFIALTVFAAVCAPANAHQRSDHAVSAWNANAGEAAVAACLAPTNNPLHESRMYAMTHLAIHDALNAIERRSRPYAFDATAKRRTSPDAAVAAAARDVLVALLEPTPRTLCGCVVAAAVAGVEADYAEALGDIPDGPAKTRGIELGRAAAAAILALRAADGSDTPRCSTRPTHRARPPASIASRRVSTLRSPRAGARSPRSCCATARSSTRVRPTP